MSSKTKKESKKISNSSVHLNDNQVTTTTENTENTEIVDTNEAPVEKKKRGRKKANVVLEVGEAVAVEIVKPPPKKRGRKPKGGKIIQQTVIIDDVVNNETNVILHLKCSLNDINNNDITTNYLNKYTYNPSVENIQSFDFDNNTNSTNFLIDGATNDEMNSKVDLDILTNVTNTNVTNTNSSTNGFGESYDSCINDKSTVDTKHHDKNHNSIKNDIWEKLNMLKVNLHNNNIYDKRSSCFWCTHDFDNPPIFIPKNEFKDSYQVYGCFCSPECSVAHLMNEKIDSSIKFERYQLLNHIYGKIYNYSKNIKPAPDPHYILDKFYGTLSIKEYRDLFKTDQLLIVVDKPLTHVFPELYEDNSDFILNQRTIPSNSTFKLKRKSANVKKTSVHDSLTTNPV
tara:strand:+ start:585 stop:1781 length:1197 start_codon:yes stop_codon:yes gene_type:complete